MGLPVVLEAPNKGVLARAGPEDENLHEAVEL